MHNARMHSRGKNFKHYIGLADRGIASKSKTFVSLILKFWKAHLQIDSISESAIEPTLTFSGKRLLRWSLKCAGFFSLWCQLLEITAGYPGQAKLSSKTLWGSDETSVVQWTNVWIRIPPQVLWEDEPFWMNKKEILWEAEVRYVLSLWKKWGKQHRNFDQNDTHERGKWTISRAQFRKPCARSQVCLTRNLVGAIAAWRSANETARTDNYCTLLPDGKRVRQWTDVRLGLACPTNTWFNRRIRNRRCHTRKRDGTSDRWDTAQTRAIRVGLRNNLRATKKKTKICFVKKKNVCVCVCVRSWRAASP